MTRDLFGSTAKRTAERTAGAPPYRGRPLALRKHILEKRALVDVLEDDGNRLVVLWRIFRTVHTWQRVPGSLWYEQLHSADAIDIATSCRGAV